ncbi:MAG: uridine kinase family protein [Mycobacteriaceae bacterium]
MKISTFLSSAPRLGSVKVLAIDGPSGSGKSTFADRLMSELQGVHTSIVRTDSLASWENPVAWWGHLEECLLLPLSRSEVGQYQELLWVKGNPFGSRWIRVPVPEVLILEGMSSARKAGWKFLSGAIWIEEPNRRERLNRAVSRDGEHCREKLKTWQLFEDGWFAVDETRARIDANCTTQST